MSLMKDPSCQIQILDSSAPAHASTPTGLPGKHSDHFLDLFHLKMHTYSFLSYWLPNFKSASKARMCGFLVLFHMVLIIL